jgi:hypothetical protein
MADGKDGEENFLMKALRIIATELPKFAKESNLPGTGGSDSENDSVMKPQSGANKEYSVTSGITELLPWIAPGVAAGSKLAAALLKRPVASSIAATAATGDPTNLIPGSAGLAVGMSGGVGDAEAVIVPASWTKDKSLLTQAIQMMQGGKRAEAIFDDTGIYAGPIDKKLRAVIPDYKAKLKNVPDDATDIRLGDILDHPDLFKVRPELARMIVNRQYVAGSNSKGAYSEGGLINPENIFLNTAKTNGPDDIMDTLLHEIQHAIQKRGDFERGAQVSKMLGHPKSGDVERELRDTIERNKNATKLLDRIGVRKTPEGWGIVEPGKEQEVPFLDLLANTLYSRG